MNNITKFVAIAAVAVLATSALAQRGQGGAGQGGGQGGGQGRGQGGQRGGFGGGGNLQMVQRPDVKADLAITTDQSGKIEALQTSMRAEMQGMFQGGGGGGDREAMMAAFAKMTEATDRKLADILTKSQNTRLLEIQIQIAGARALLLPAVQKALGMNEAQLQKVKDLQAKQQEANTAVMEKMRNGELDREQLTEIRTKNDKVLGDELVKIPTAEQTAKLKTLAGKPFKADTGGHA